MTPNETFELFWAEYARKGKPVVFSESEMEVARYYFQMGYLKGQETAFPPPESGVMEEVEKILQDVSGGLSGNAGRCMDCDSGAVKIKEALALLSNANQGREKMGVG